MKPSLVILAAGAGSRYGGIKQIDSIGANDETLLDYSVYDAKRAGFGKVYFIIRHAIEKDFTDRLFTRIAANINAEYVFQEHDTLLTQAQCDASAARTKPWGTAHALLCAKNAVKEPFAVINADDFYGKNSYKVMADYLAKQPVDSSDYAMVGYVLNKTMSRSGTVSRGLCETENGWLKTITEHTKIGFASPDSTKAVSDFNGKLIQLTGTETASMNFFGFSPSFFNALQEYFDNFIEKNVTSEKAEAFLPEAASRQIQQGSARMKVLNTDSQWFGMTYKEDRDIVKQSIAKKITDGEYPVRLWS